MRFSIFAQYALPHRFLSRLVYWGARWTWRPWKSWLIGQIVKRFNVDMSEASEPDVAAYAHFNEFFTRSLKPGARTAAAGENVILCPADGRISQLGAIEAGRIFQAKGQSYTAAELLADEAAAQVYADGHFVTVYLSPRDYHRVHMPLSGTLVETVHVPGRLFSVAPTPVANIPRLFARNERLVCHFEGEHGPFVSVMVGALLVSSVSTVWGGLTIPAYAREVKRVDYRGQGIRLERFAEMARFNMGSTVILLFPRNAALDPALQAEQAVRVGQGIGLVNP